MAAFKDVRDKIASKVKSALGNWEGLIPSTELTGIDYEQAKFIQASIQSLYERILWRVVNEVDADEKTLENIQRSCATNYTLRNQKGFIEYVAKAMSQKQVIILTKREVEYVQGLSFYLFESEVKGAGWAKRDDEVINPDEIILDFSHFKLTDMLRVYYMLLFNALDGAGKGVNISQALLLKIADLNKITHEDRNLEILKNQLSELDESIRGGRLAFVDGDSSVEFASFDIEPTKLVIDFIYRSIANVIGYPLSFVTGEDTGSSLGDTGEAERKRIRRANEYFFLSIILPLLEDVYRKTFTLRTEIENSKQMVEMFNWAESDTMLTYDAKVRTLSNMFGFKKSDFNPEEKIQDPITRAAAITPAATTKQDEDDLNNEQD